MITAKIERIEQGTLKNITEQVYEPLTIEQRLDRELDSGNFEYIHYDVDSTDTVEPPLTPFRVTLFDGESSPLTADFVGTDTRALLRGKFGNGNTRDTAPMFRHSIMLTEPTKLLEGTLIDGFAVTQPDAEQVLDTESSSISFSSFDSKEYEDNGIVWHGYKTIECDHPIESVVVDKCNVNGNELTPTIYFDKGNNYFVAEFIFTGGNPGTIYLAYTYTYIKSVPGQSLKDVVDRLLAVSPLRKESQRAVYSLNPDSKVLTLLTNTVAPQFKWSTQTTVWECLCDIGSVIDAIPRLISSDGNRYCLVDFDLINDNTVQIEQLLDIATYDYGEEVDDSQYNSQLRSVVENVKEE